MYEYIKGTLAEATPIYATIDAGGVGYKILISANTFSKLPQPSSLVQLYTTYVVRELSQTLYGFFSTQEREIFELLLNVSGIGPKIALSVIGHLPMDSFYQAIQSHDVAAIARVPGIGKKTAERLIIEMRDKLAGIAGGPNPADFAIAMPAAQNSVVRDAMHALINLGYKQIAAQNALKKAMKEEAEDLSLADLITASLKYV